MSMFTELVPQAFAETATDAKPVVLRVTPADGLTAKQKLAQEAFRFSGRADNGTQGIVTIYAYACEEKPDGTHVFYATEHDVTPTYMAAADWKSLTQGIGRYIPASIVAVTAETGPTQEVNDG